MLTRSLIFALLIAVSSCSTTSIQAQDPTEDLLTPGEESGFDRHATHDEMVNYLSKVNARTSDMILESYGKTMEGRELVLAIFSKSGIQTPAEAHASGKPVVVLGANVHGFNYVLREALMIMARDLGTPGTDLNNILDDVIVIMAPSKNPDGLELQSRFNPVGADLNRDYIMLEQPSMAAYIGNLINKWHPHIIVDGHDGGAVQYGGAYPYHLLYQATALAAADLSITELADREVFPFLNDRMEEEGFKSFYWAQGDEEAWYGGGNAPRMGRNYGGLANKLTILFEHAAWQGMETGVESGIVAFSAIMEYAAQNSDELISTIESARGETVNLGKRAEGQVPVEEEMVAEDFRVTYQIEHPDNSDELITVEDAPLIKKPEPTRSRDRPWAYVLPPQAKDAAAMLKRHNIKVEKVADTTEAQAVAYEMGGVGFEDSDNNHRSALLLEVASEVEDEFEIPKGSYLIRTGQLLGRVASHMLEPETTDNIFYWNRMTPLIPIAEFHAYQNNSEIEQPPLLPLRKLMSETGIPLRSD